MSRILICGSRDFDDQELFDRVMSHLPPEYFPIEAVMEGGAEGADRMAREWALEYRDYYGFQYLLFRAEWDKYGRSAGPRRNARMIAEGRPTLVIAFYSQPTSRGTDNMVQQAQAAGIPVRKFGRV